MIFAAASGEKSIEIRYENETIWTSQKMVAVLFGVDVHTIRLYGVMVQRSGYALPFSSIGLNMFHVEQNISIQIIALLLRGDSHPRKLAKELGISHTTVLRKLQVFLDGNVVDFRTEGKNRVYFLKKTLEARVYIFMVEYYALGNLIREAPHLRSVIRAIQERQDIPLAILFGSYAKGTANRKSDIDVYIDTDDKEVKKELERNHSKLSIKYGAWDPDNLLIQEIVKNHVILKGAERYYEQTKFFE